MGIIGRIGTIVNARIESIKHKQEIEKIRKKDYETVLAKERHDAKMQSAREIAKAEADAAVARAKLAAKQGRPQGGKGGGGGLLAGIQNMNANMEVRARQDMGLFGGSGGPGKGSGRGSGNNKGGGDPVWGGGMSSEDARLFGMMPREDRHGSGGHKKSKRSRGTTIIIKK